MATAGPQLVLGLGDPVMDICVQCSQEFLASIGARPGGCVVVGPEEMAALQRAVASALPVRIPGGSAANVLKGLAGVSGGEMRCQMVGMVGEDEAGAFYTRELAAHGVEPRLLTSTTGAPTARCLCLVTPDGQRTMRTCLGAAAELKSCEQVGRGLLSGLSPAPALLHCEGYCLYRPELARGAMAAAKAAGATVSLDLASFEVVRACWPALQSLLRDGLVDVVFANEEEAGALLDAADATTGAATGASAAAAAAATDTAAAATRPEGPDGRMARVEAVQTLVLRHARCCVVSLGARGAVARASDGRAGAAPAAKVTVVDTIGAGDLFSAGFLHAYARGCALSTACAAGCAAGAEAVQTRGAALSDAAWARLRAAIAALVAAPASSSRGAEDDDAARQRDSARAVACKPRLGAPRAVGSYGSLMASSAGSCASQLWLNNEPAEPAPAP